MIAHQINADEHTEELLLIHENEIRRLKEERRLKAPLLASIRKYFEICEEEKELAAAAQDQSRLLGRGPRDPGRLLREEKMRKRVTREKPRVSKLCNPCFIAISIVSLSFALLLARTGIASFNSCLGRGLQ